MHNLRSTLVNLLACFLLLITQSVLAGTTYGIYDARTMAMGGASVASAINDNAQFYNGALLAFNEDIEERTEDGRILFPLVATQLSESAIELENVSQDDPSSSISRAINDFNNTRAAPEAQIVVDTMADLEASLAKLEDDLTADLYFGTAVSEPGKFQGAAFFLGVRLLAGGQSTITDEDRAILSTYQEGLTFVASGGTTGTAHPELFDANGALINPTGDFDSSATATGAAITETGVAMSKQFNWFGGPIAAGISFKVLHIETFEDIERIVDDRISIEQNSEPETNVNFDIGLIKELGQSWRVGLAVKDAIPYNYKTSLGTVVRLRPRPRIGASYRHGRLQIAADLDLIRSEPLGQESPAQEAAIGAEWALDSPWRLRAGYRHDLTGGRNGIVSAGAGTQWKRMVIDVAYAQGQDTRALALQFGVAF